MHYICTRGRSGNGLGTCSSVSAAGATARGGRGGLGGDLTPTTTPTGSTSAAVRVGWWTFFWMSSVELTALDFGFPFSGERPAPRPRRHHHHHEQPPSRGNRKANADDRNKCREGGPDYVCVGVCSRRSHSPDQRTPSLPSSPLVVFASGRWIVGVLCHGPR